MYELRELIQLVKEAGLDELEWTRDGVSVAIKKELPVVIAVPIAESVIEVTGEIPQPEPEDQQGASVSLLTTLRSPYIGVFADAPEPGAEPYVRVGDTVTADMVVCNCDVEAMDLKHAVKAGCDGMIVKVFAEKGQLIEYGQPLFLIDTREE